MRKFILWKSAGQAYGRVVNFVTMLRKMAMAIAVKVGWVQSDRSRWAKIDNLSVEWDERTKEIAKLISPGASVLEFGAGRMTLKKLLPPGCKYTPSDIVDRGEGTIVCDLNAPKLPAFPKHNTAVLGGVLEYVVDVPRIVSVLADTCQVVVIGYCTSLGDSASEKIKRRAKGWSSDYTEEEMEKMFMVAGYRTVFKKAFRATVLYKFVK